MKQLLAHPFKETLPLMTFHSLMHVLLVEVFLVSTAKHNFQNLTRLFECVLRRTFSGKCLYRIANFEICQIAVATERTAQRKSIKVVCTVEPLLNDLMNFLQSDYQIKKPQAFCFSRFVVPRQFATKGNFLACWILLFS